MTHADAGSLTSSELERALTFFASYGGVEREDVTIRLALHKFNIALPRVSDVERLVSHVIEGSIGVVSDNQPPHQQSVGASSSSLVVASGSGINGTLALRSMKQSSPTFIVDTSNTTTSNIGIQRGYEDAATFAPTSRYVSQDEWIRLIQLLKECHVMANEAAGAHTEERASFNAIATSSTRSKPLLSSSMSVNRPAADNSDHNRGFVTVSSTSPPPTSSCSDLREDSTTVSGSYQNSSSNRVIASDKLLQLCKDFGLTFDIEAFLDTLDDNGDGEVDFEEFLALVTSPEDSIDAYLSSFVACGGRETFVSPTTGLVKHLPTDVCDGDVVVLLLPTKELRTALPYLPLHIIAEVPPRESQEHASTLSRKATNLQRVLVRAMSSHNFTKGTFTQAGPNEVNSHKAGGASSSTPRKMPYDCDASLVTLDRFAKIMHRWGKKPNELNSYLQYHFNSNNSQHAGKMTLSAKESVGLAASQQQHQQPPSLLVSAVQRDFSTLRDSSRSMFDQDNQGPSAVQLLLKSLQDQHDSSLAGLSPTVATASQSTSVKFDSSDGGIEFLEISGGGATRSRLNLNHSNNNNHLSQQKQNVVTGSHHESGAAGTLEQSFAARSITGSKAISAAAESAVSHHYQRVAKHHNDNYESQFRDISPPKHIPRFSPKRTQENRVPLHAPKEPYVPQHSARGSNRTVIGEDVGGLPVGSPDSTLCSSFNTAAASPHIVGKQQQEASSPSFNRVQYSSRHDLSAAHVAGHNASGNNTTPRVLRGRQDSRSPPSTTAASGDVDRSHGRHTSPLTTRNHGRAFQHEDNSTPITVGGGSVTRNGFDPAAALFAGPPSPPRARPASHSFKRYFTGTNHSSSPKAPPSSLSADHQHHHPASASANPKSNTTNHDTSLDVWWKHIRHAFMSKEQLTSNTKSHMSHLQQWVRPSSGSLNTQHISASSSSMGLSPTDGLATSNNNITTTARTSAAGHNHPHARRSTTGGSHSRPASSVVPPSTSAAGRKSCLSSSSIIGGVATNSCNNNSTAAAAAAPALHVPTRPNTAGRARSNQTSTPTTGISATAAAAAASMQTTSPSPVLVKSTSPLLMHLVSQKSPSGRKAQTARSGSTGRSTGTKDRSPYGASQNNKAVVNASRGRRPKQTAANNRQTSPRRLARHVSPSLHRRHPREESSDASIILTDGLRRAISPPHVAVKENAAALTIQIWFRLRRSVVLARREVEVRKQLRKCLFLMQAVGRGYVCRIHVSNQLRAYHIAQRQRREKLAYERLRMNASSILLRVYLGYAERAELYGLKCETERLEEENLLEGNFLSNFSSASVSPATSVALGSVPSNKAPMVSRDTTVATGRNNNTDGTIHRENKQDDKTPSSGPLDSDDDNNEGAARLDSDDATNENLLLSHQVARQFDLPPELLLAAGFATPKPPVADSLPTLMKANTPAQVSMFVQVDAMSSFPTPGGIESNSSASTPSGAPQRRSSSEGSTSGGAQLADNRDKAITAAGISRSPVASSWGSHESGDRSPNASQGSSHHVGFVTFDTLGMEVGDNGKSNPIFHHNHHSRARKQCNSRGGRIGRLASGSSSSGGSTTHQDRVFGVALYANPFSQQGATGERSTSSTDAYYRTDNGFQSPNPHLLDSTTSRRRSSTVSIGSSNGARSRNVFGKSVGGMINSVLTSISGTPSPLGSNAGVGGGGGRLSKQYSEVLNFAVPFTSAGSYDDEDEPTCGMIDHSASQLSSHANKFDGFAAPSLIYRVTRGFNARRKLLIKKWKIPLMYIQRLARGFRARRKLGDQRWAILDAKSSVGDWHVRHAAARRIQCFFRCWRATELYRLAIRRAQLRTEVRVSAESRLL